MQYYNQITDEYLKALRENVIYPKFKVELLDFDENVLEEITQDISATDTGSISINYQQGLRRSCSVTLINTFKKYMPSQAKYVWINTKFKLYLGISVKKNITSKHFFEVEPFVNNSLLYQDASGKELKYRGDTQSREEDIYWFSQGVFLLTNPTVLKDKSKKTVTLNGVDKFGIFGSETSFRETEGTYLIPAGTTVENAIKSILNLPLLQDSSRGVTIPLDPKTPIIDSIIGQEELVYDIKKSPNSFLSDILIEIGNMFACDIFYDVNGRLNFTKGNEKKDMNDYSSIWDYVDIFPEYFSPELALDFTKVYNVIKVVATNASVGSDITTTLKNEKYDSPTRIQLIGEKIKYIESSFCYNAERTLDFAKYLLRKYSIVQSSLKFQSAFIPHLDVNCVINISDKYYNYENQRFVIQSLNMPFNTQNLIDVEATNTANIPYFEY